jgi:hypothetical protein
MERLTDKLYHKFKAAPGVDREFIKKCLAGIVAMGDSAVESKLTMLVNLL